MTVPAKKKQLISTGRDLFWQFGIRKVTIEEICKKSNVSKMTYYKYFQNKNELVIAILDQIYDEGMKDYRTIMAESIPFTQKVEKQIQLKMNQTQQLSHAFLTDLHSNDHDEIVVYFQQMKKRVVQLVLEDYQAAQLRGDIRQNIKPEFILFFLNHLYELAENAALRSMYHSPQDLIIELVQFFFYGILPHKE